MNKINTTLCRAVLFCTCLFPISALSVNIGYYDMSAGQGNPNQITPITAAGQTAVDILDLSPVELGGIAILMVQNPSNGGYGAEYLAALANIQSAVNTGMILIIHDRFVTDAATILPGGAGFSFTRDTNAVIDILNNTTLVTNGPNGVITNTTLDGGNSSNHGFAAVGSLPGTGTFILSRTIPTEVVSFYYPFGNGAVYYSTIPLDFYLAGSGANPPADDFRNIYAPNVIAELLAFVPAAGPQSIPALGGIGLLLLTLSVAWFGRRRIHSA